MKTSATKIKKFLTLISIAEQSRLRKRRKKKKNLSRVTEALRYDGRLENRKGSKKSGGRRRRRRGKEFFFSLSDFRKITIFSPTRHSIVVFEVHDD